MDYLQLFVPLTPVPSAFLNTFQNVTRSLKVASSIAQNLLPTANGGMGVIFQTFATPIPTATPILIDNTADYRDRILLDGVCVFPPSAVEAIPGNDDWKLNDPATALPSTRLWGKYTGTGAVSNLATLAAVSAGNPPLNGEAGIGHRSYRITLAQHLDPTETGPWLYVSPTTGFLYVYHSHAGDVWLLAALMFSAKTGLR